VVTVRALHSTAHRVLVVSAAAAVVVTIGVSRLYLGVHWLTDVLAGWFLGGAWLSLCVAALLLGQRGAGPSSDQARVVEGLPAGEPAPKPTPPGRAA
jgi:membrane-associated phospholipid phosphatase